MNKEKQKKYKNNIILVVILAVIFGMVSGIVGGLVARSYLIDGGAPFLSEINIPNKNYNNTNLIIRDAKKVIVQQDIKVFETINSVNNSIVGIFKKSFQPIDKENDSDIFDLSEYYQINKEIGQGFIITSDGWIITSFVFKQSDVLGDYVVITKDREIYVIDKIVKDSLTPFIFLHISASELPVRKFAPSNEINDGQLTLCVNWDEEVLLSRILDKQKIGKNIILSSDDFINKLALINDLPKKFNGSVLFNLSGDVVGFSDNNGNIEPIYHITGAIKSLLARAEIKRANLGVSYINLDSLIKIDGKDAFKGGYSKGAIIYKDGKEEPVVKGSSADLAGLKFGDIITHIGIKEINKNNSLTDLIQNYIASDKINIIYLRDGKKYNVDVVLGE